MKRTLVLISIITLIGCEKESIQTFPTPHQQEERNITIKPFSKLQTKDTTIVLDGDSRISRYCCTMYRRNGLPYGYCYSSSGECVSCQEVCDEWNNQN